MTIVAVTYVPSPIIEWLLTGCIGHEWTHPIEENLWKDLAQIATHHLQWVEWSARCYCHGPLARYAKLRGAHAPGMPGTFSPSPQVSDPDMHHGTCVTHVPWCMPGSLTSGFLWNRRRVKRSRHSRRMRNLQFYVSGKRPIVWEYCGQPGLAALTDWMFKETHQGPVSI